MRTMRNKSKKLSVMLIFFVAFVICFNLLNIRGYSAEDSKKDIEIISETKILRESAKEWAKKRGATKEFIDLVDIYYDTYKDHGNVNPALAYVQAAKETGYGRYGSNLTAASHNPCGLKMTQGGGDYDASIHMKFKTWQDGVSAHIDHLALYAGAKGYPKKETQDPRHFTNLFGKCKTVCSLGGNYAPSATYGDEVLELYNSLDKFDDEYRIHVIENLPAIGSIDYIDTQDMVSQNKITVKGFVIAGKKITNMQLFVGGKLKSTFNADISRPDVKLQYPLYNSENCGFSVEADISDLEQKNQEVKVVCTIADGTIYEIRNNFDLEKKPPLSYEELKRLENTISIVLDDDIYDNYNKYINNKVIDYNSDCNLKIIKSIYDVLISDGYYVVISSEKNNQSKETNRMLFDTSFKERAQIKISKNSVFDEMGKEYVPSCYISSISKASYHITSNFNYADNNKLKCINEYFIINCDNTFAMKVKFDINKFKGFNDNNSKKEDDFGIEYIKLPTDK